MLIGKFFGLRVNLMKSPMASAPGKEERRVFFTGVSLSLDRECDIHSSVSYTN